MVQSRAPLYPLQDGQLLYPQLCPEVGGSKHGEKMPPINSKDGLAMLAVLQSRLSRKTHML